MIWRRWRIRNPHPRRYSTGIHTINITTLYFYYYYIHNMFIATSLTSSRMQRASLRICSVIYVFSAPSWEWVSTHQQGLLNYKSCSGILSILLWLIFLHDQEEFSSFSVKLPQNPFGHLIPCLSAIENLAQDVRRAMQTNPPVPVFEPSILLLLNINCLNMKLIFR